MNDLQKRELLSLARGAKLKVEEAVEEVLRNAIALDSIELSGDRRHMAEALAALSAIADAVSSSTARVQASVGAAKALDSVIESMTLDEDRSGRQE